MQAGKARPASKVQQHHPDKAGGDGKKFYIPHKAVVRKNAETTKIHIVYDVSARESSSAASLNECLEVGPPLQN